LIRVAIADDHYLVREGTSRLLEASGEVTVVASVEDGDRLREAVEQHSPDAAIVDIRMPPTHQMEGIDLAIELRATYPEMGVVVLSQHVNSLYAFELFKNGTVGLAYLLKDRVGDLDELLRALREVTSGGSVIDPAVVEGLFQRQRHKAQRPLDTLTPREREVLASMAEGRSNASISETLFISQSAVEKHINAIFAKLALSVEGTDTHRRVAAVLAFLGNQDEAQEEQTPG
jgi:DNA-binding NarL/FixJ family response regulator